MDTKQLQMFNQKIIEEFRANDGAVGGDFAGAPMLLLTTIGAKSGEARLNPLVYGLDGDQMFVIASKAGAPTHPHWYLNLKANPEVTLEVGSQKFTARAVEASEPERTRLFNQMAEAMPVFKTYEAKAGRVIPVIKFEL